MGDRWTIDDRMPVRRDGKVRSEDAFIDLTMKSG